jgi:hypothetical protein
MVSLEHVREVCIAMLLNDYEWDASDATDAADILCVRTIFARTPLTICEPTVTLVDNMEGRTLEVPASVVHEMEYPEAVTYTPIDFTETDECNICGACVADRDKHTAFHGRAAL